MKMHIALLFLLCLTGIPVHAEKGVEEKKDGEIIFEQRGCDLCHHDTQDQRRMGLGPSWTQISEVYKGRHDDLRGFLRGKREQEMSNEKNLVMHGEIVRLRTLSEAEMKILEKFIQEKLAEY